MHILAADEGGGVPRAPIYSGVDLFAVGSHVTHGHSDAWVGGYVGGGRVWGLEVEDGDISRLQLYVLCLVLTSVNSPPDSHTNITQPPTCLLLQVCCSDNALPL